MTSKDLLKYGIKLPKEYEDWKAELAMKIVKKSQAKGLDPKKAVATAMVESGITPAALGDKRCSVGVYQVNHCSRKNAPTDTITAWVDETSAAKKIFNGNEMRAIVKWNWPVAAYKGFYANTNYYYKVKKTLAQITTKPTT